MFKTLVPQKADALFAAKDRATAPEEFVRLFLLKEESAQRHETKTDNILDGKEDGKETKKDAKQSQEDFIDETVKKRELHKHLFLLLPELIVYDDWCAKNIRMC